MITLRGQILASRTDGDTLPLSLPSPLPVCPSEKSPCVDSKRPRVYGHHARIDKTKEKTREDQDEMCCVCACLVFPFFFLIKITRPSNNFEFSKLPVTNPEHDFLPGNFLFVRLQIKLFSRIILVIILPPMVTWSGSRWFHGTRGVATKRLMETCWSLM